MNFYFFISGMFTDDLQEAHLIIPRRVNHVGEILSHNLTHHHEHKQYEKFKKNSNSFNDDEHKVHYHIDFQNETLHLELE